MSLEEWRPQVHEDSLNMMRKLIYYVFKIFPDFLNLIYILTHVRYSFQACLFVAKNARESWNIVRRIDTSVFLDNIIVRTSLSGIMETYICVGFGTFNRVRVC